MFSRGILQNTQWLWVYSDCMGLGNWVNQVPLKVIWTWKTDLKLNSLRQFPNPNLTLIFRVTSCSVVRWTANAECQMTLKFIVISIRLVRWVNQVLFRVIILGNWPETWFTQFPINPLLQNHSTCKIQRRVLFAKNDYSTRIMQSDIC